MFSIWIGVVLLFAVFGLFVLVVVGASPRGTNYEKTRAKARAEKLKTAREEAMTALTTYGWVDKTKGVARIPINEAMKLTVADLARKKPMPAGPIATPPPQNTAPATASPTPSPTAGASATPKPTSIGGPASENRGQPAAASNPPSAAAQPAGAVSATPSPSPVGSPLPVPGKSP